MSPAARQHPLLMDQNPSSELSSDRLYAETVEEEDEEEGDSEDEYGDGDGSSRSSSSGGSSSSSKNVNNLEDEDEKKRAKRAANRKSAQLSRLRKKRYIEDLSAEYAKLKVLFLPPSFALSFPLLTLPSHYWLATVA